MLGGFLDEVAGGFKGVVHGGKFEVSAGEFDEVGLLEELVEDVALVGGEVGRLGELDEEFFGGLVGGVEVEALVEIDAEDGGELGDVGVGLVGVVEGAGVELFEGLEGGEVGRNGWGWGAVAVFPEAGGESAEEVGDEGGE